MDTALSPCNPEALRRAVDLLADGQLVAFPTDTVYGLAARADNDDAIRRVYEVKGRPAHKALIIHVRDSAQARGLVANWTKQAQLLSETFWPGPLTLVLAAKANLVTAASADDGTIAMRAPAHPDALDLLAACPFPVAASSSNLSGEPPPISADQVMEQLNGRIPLILDGGNCPMKQPSTLVRLGGDGEPVEILREGALDRAQLSALVTIR